MRSAILSVHEGLGISRRLPLMVRGEARISGAELAVLAFLGVCAALLSTVVRLNLGLPGHNIIRVVFPMALGMALVPRCGAASLVGLSGMGAALALTAGRAGGLGVGAATSLALTGLLVDLALVGARSGRSIYVRLTLAGLVANLAALAVRGGSKLLAGGMVDGLPLELWWPKAVLTYPLCGLLAGLLSAAVWFRVSARQSPHAD